MADISKNTINELGMLQFLQTPSQNMNRLVPEIYIQFCAQLRQNLLSGIGEIPLFPVKRDFAARFFQAKIIIIIIIIIFKIMNSTNLSPWTFELLLPVTFYWVRETSYGKYCVNNQPKLSDNWTEYQNIAHELMLSWNHLQTQHSILVFRSVHFNYGGFRDV